MELGVLIIFILVYFGMFLGGIPGLALDRTGVALLGAIALLALGYVRTEEAVAAVDMPTIALLLGLMILSAQFRLAGFYSWLVRRTAGGQGGETGLFLALVVLTAGVLSAFLANDIVCLAATPVLVETCLHRGLNPKPFLIALACASNVGSAATLIGNPQNMLIGQVLRLPFMEYALDAILPSALGLAVVWAVVRIVYRGRWHAPREDRTIIDIPELDRWQAYKGSFVLCMLLIAFLIAPWPREVVALAAAGVLLCSRRMRSRKMLGLVDWQLLVLFTGLFVVNGALRSSGWMDSLIALTIENGIDPARPGWLFLLSTALSNLVSNVPAVMLLLPSAVHPSGGLVLALSSTLAGNLLLVGSIANIIVVDQASRCGVRITWTEHARVGVPVTILTLLIAWGWLLTVVN